jgi:hypothetical protein
MIYLQPMKRIFPLDDLHKSRNAYLTDNYAKNSRFIRRKN